LSQACIAPVKVSIYTGGTECVDFSSLNGHAKGEAGRSATTLRASFTYIRVHRPSVVVLENVFAKKIVQDVVRQLRGLGYITMTFVINSRHAGLPQSRTRLYFVGILCRDVTISVDTSLWPDLLAQCFKAYPRTYVDNILGKDCFSSVRVVLKACLCGAGQRRGCAAEVHGGPL
jgi:site-specific DNA-cytosine methylase